MAEPPAELETRDLETVFRLHYTRLVRALSMAAGSEAASDAVMDAFVQAHRHWSRISTYEDPIAWVRRVAVNRLLTFRRDERRRSQLLHRAFFRSSSYQTDDVVDTNGDLVSLLRTLSRQQTIAAALFYLDDLSVAEVAKAMDVSESTVKTHLRRARDHLSSQLEVNRQ